MSKGLEAFERIKNTPTYDNGLVKDFHPSCCEIIEKELKALEIIIEKRVQIHTFVIDNPTWEEVEEDWDYWFSKRPTREEYDLLKEVLL